MCKRCRVASDRGLRRPCPDLERPNRVMLRRIPVAIEDARLENRDRTTPAPGRSVLPALPIPDARAVEPGMGVPMIPLHYEG